MMMMMMNSKGGLHRGEFSRLRVRHAHAVLAVGRI